MITENGGTVAAATNPATTTSTSSPLRPLSDNDAPALLVENSLLEENSLETDVRRVEVVGELRALATDVAENERLEIAIRVAEQQNKFLEDNPWLSSVAGKLGFEKISDLYNKSDEGVLSLKLPLVAAISSAEELVNSRFQLDGKNLLKDSNFIGMIIGYFLEYSGKRGLVHVNKSLYRFARERIDDDDQLAHTLLGNLADCGGCLC